MVRRRREFHLESGGCDGLVRPSAQDTTWRYHEAAAAAWQMGGRRGVHSEMTSSNHYYERAAASGLAETWRGRAKPLCMSEVVGGPWYEREESQECAPLDFSRQTHHSRYLQILRQCVTTKLYAVIASFDSIQGVQKYDYSTKCPLSRHGHKTLNLIFNLHPSA